MAAHGPPVQPVTTRIGGSGRTPWIAAAALLLVLASLAWVGLFGDAREPQRVALPPVATPEHQVPVASPSPQATPSAAELEIEFGQNVPRRFPVVFKNNARAAEGGVGVGRYLVFITEREPRQLAGMVRLTPPDENGNSSIELLHVDRRPRDLGDIEQSLGRWDLELDRLSDASRGDRVLLSVTQLPLSGQAGAPALVRQGYELVVRMAGSRTIPLLLINVRSLPTG